MKKTLLFTQHRFPKQNTIIFILIVLLNVFIVYSAQNLGDQPIYYQTSNTSVAQTPPRISSDPSSFPVIPSNLQYQEKASVVISLNFTSRIKSYSSYSNHIEIWMKQLKNHSTHAELGMAPVQQSTLLATSTNIKNILHLNDPQDVYNNTIDYYSTNLTYGQEIEISRLYRLRLAEIDWEIKNFISENDDGNFLDAYLQIGLNNSDLWYQSLIQAEPHLEVNNTELITLTLDICKGKVTLQDKIRAILEWMNNNIEGVNTLHSQGAYQTVLLGSGDCSDYTTLFVTMLRILKVPTRRITGMQIIDSNSEFHPFREGEQFQYNEWIPGHAWAEYFHPNYGFISLDPTFARFNPNKYMNYIGYYYIHGGIGECYFEGIDPPFAEPIYGWGILPYFEADSKYATRPNITITITIENTERYIWLPKFLDNRLIIIIGPISGVVFIVANIYRRRKKKNAEKHPTTIQISTLK